jgi:carboxyl-terminal processing protease
VDLRGNGGGNMWPMIAGLGPVLGDGPAGVFVDPVGAQTEWGYERGSSTLDGTTQVAVSAPYRLRRQQPRVAVLSDNRIASSGEATLISFRGRPGARSFGTATCGLSTSNRGYALSDGAVLILTVAVMGDRHRNKYGDSIAPDEIIADPSQAVARAIAWLRSAAASTAAAR